MRVDLGKDKDGNDRWAEVTDLDDMPRKVETAIFRMFPDMGVDGETKGFTPALLARMRDTMIAHLIEEWSFDKPLPKGSPEKLEWMPRSAYRALQEATGDHWEAVGFSKGRAESPDQTGETSSD